ncbi:hypothetical protein F5X99DRAFT_402106 [Biscogniauxia marginata]|nr:hypothetical protein F5X99DRAFT_402106 [Biscogniauxia marginata]
MGAPLPVTGCSCATKLCARPVCKPHRLKYLLQMDQMADVMDKFIRGSWNGRMCFICQKQPGVDHYDFKGPSGGTDSFVWGCMSCGDVVATGPAGRGILPGGGAWGFPEPEPSPPNETADNAAPNTEPGESMWGLEGIDVDTGLIDPGLTDPALNDQGLFDQGPIDQGMIDQGPNDPGSNDPGFYDPGLNDPDHQGFIDPALLQMFGIAPPSDLSFPNPPPE